MRSRSGHERRESLEEGQRLEDDRAGAIAPGAPQAVDHAAVRIDREPLAGDGGAGDVPAQPLESGAVVAFDRDLGVEREAREVAAQLAGKEERPTVALTTAPRQWLAALRSERDAPFDRSCAEEREQGFIGRGFVVLGLLLARQAAATLEVAHDAAVQGRGDVRDVLIADVGRGLEAGRGEQTLAGVDAVEDQRVEVQVQVEGPAEPLSEDHRARAAAGRAGCRGAVAQPVGSG